MPRSSDDAATRQDCSDGFTSELTLADAEAVGATVDAWLSEVLRDARQD